MNRFKVMPQDEATALKLHNQIVAQSKVITALSLAATDFFQKGDYEAARSSYENLKLAEFEMNKVYRELNTLRQRAIKERQELEEIAEVVAMSIAKEMTRIENARFI